MGYLELASTFSGMTSTLACSFLLGATASISSAATLLRDFLGVATLALALTAGLVALAYFFSHFLSTEAINLQISENLACFWDNTLPCCLISLSCADNLI